MTGKEKVRLALSHTEGPVPVDFGATPTSGIHVMLMEKLRDYYGLEKRPVILFEPMAGLGLVEDDLKEALGVDTEHFWLNVDVYGNNLDEFKEWRTPWGQVVLVSKDFTTTEDKNGDVLVYAQGDTGHRPAARMPKTGLYFDAEERQKPILNDEQLKLADNLEEFGPISDNMLNYYKKRAAEMQSSKYSLCGLFGGTSLGDISLIPGLGLKEPKGIRGTEEWYVSTVTRRDFLKEIFAAEVEIALENLTKIHDAIGDIVSCTFICGADFGTQSSQFCSVETFGEMYKPFYRKVCDWVHANTKWKAIKHSCGAIDPLIPEFIDAGFDILNPIQVSASGMDRKYLKEKYGKQLVFWGGGVDTQRTLPFGTPGDVRKEVMEALEIFSKGGGYVFNTIHNSQADVPVENFVAMIEIVKKFNSQ